MKLHLPTRRGWIGALIAGGLAIGVPIALHVPHHHVWEAIPGFYAWYGAAGCAAIVVVSKALGKWLLQKPEGWYD